MMAKRGQKSSKREAEAGKKNLEAWLRGNPSGGNLKHGIYPKISRRRFSDLRTREGKALNAILKGIVKEIGPELDTRQSVILALISAKLIVVLQIQKYLETLPELVNQREGKVPYIIEHTFPRYSAGLIKLLDSLYRDGSIRSRKIPNYHDIVQSLKTNAAARAPSSDPGDEGHPIDFYKS